MGFFSDSHCKVLIKRIQLERLGRIQVTVVARELPEQHLFSQGWASPWAGANWSPIGPFSARQLKWEKACL